MCRFFLAEMVAVPGRRYLAMLQPCNLDAHHKPSLALAVPYATAIGRTGLQAAHFTWAAMDVEVLHKRGMTGIKYAHHVEEFRLCGSARGKVSDELTVIPHCSLLQQARSATNCGERKGRGGGGRIMATSSRDLG